MANEPFDLRTTSAHLGLGSRAVPIPDFAWTPESLASYERDHLADGAEGRLVVMANEEKTHEHVIEMRAAAAVINPPAVWQRSVVHEPGSVLFITPGLGTEHRPRAWRLRFHPCSGGRSNRSRAHGVV